MAKSIVDGVLFSDGELPGEPRERIVVTISRQNALPSELKKKAAAQAKAKGCNAVKNFETAQSAHHWLFSASILMWDTESLYGVGEGIRIAREQMSEALK